MAQQTNSEVIEALKDEGVAVDGFGFHAASGFNGRALEIIQSLESREAVLALLAEVS